MRVPSSGQPTCTSLLSHPVILTRPPAEEYGEAARGYAAAFGTWSVNEADKTLIRLIEGSLIPNAEGREVKASVSVADGELKLSGTASNGVKVDQLWKR